MTLIASHHSHNEENEVSDYELIKPSYEELQNAFDELHEERKEINCVFRKKSF